MGAISQLRGAFADLVDDVAVRPERPVGAEVVLLALGDVLLRDAVPPVLVHRVQVQLPWGEGFGVKSCTS